MIKLLNILLFPALLFKNLGSFYLFTLLGLSVASGIYWPDSNWIIFPTCVLAGVTAFKLIDECLLSLGDSVRFIGRCIRDKDIHLSDRVDTRVK